MAEKPEKPDQESDSEVTFWNAENVDRIPGRRLASLYVNRYHVLVSDQRTRIVFGESLVGEDDVTWYNSVTFPISDAVLLAKAILEVTEATAADQRKQETPADGKK